MAIAMARLLFTFVVFACALMVRTAESAPCRPIVCEGVYPYHLQGVATDGTNVFWSFTTVLAKTDLSGRLLAKSEIESGHMGDVCWKDGAVYVGMNFGKGADGARRGDAVWVYNAAMLERTAVHSTPEPAWCNNGVEWFGGSFWIITSAPRHSECNYLYEYTPDFRYKNCILVKSGWTNLGVQTVCRVGDALYLGCYGSGDDKEQPHKSCTVCIDGGRLLAASRTKRPASVDMEWRRDVNTADGMLVLGGEVWEAHSVLLSAKGGKKTWTGRLSLANGLKQERNEQ